jgi:hypothetical protein
MLRVGLVAAECNDTPLCRQGYAAAANVELGQRSIAPAQRTEENARPFFSDWVPF